MAAVDGGSDVLDEFPGRFALLVEKTPRSKSKQKIEISDYLNYLLKYCVANDNYTKIKK
jgi:hypothetical protein